MPNAPTKHPGGPTTPEGKRRSSLNAMKDGLRARSPQAIELIASELNATFDQLLDDLRTYYFPRDPIEGRLVHRIARCLWRLMLSERMEGRIISRSGLPNSPAGSYEKILKYERLVDIHLHRAIEALNKMRVAKNDLHRPGEPPFPGRI